MKELLCLHRSDGHGACTDEVYKCALVNKGVLRGMDESRLASQKRRYLQAGHGCRFGKDVLQNRAMLD